MPLEFNLNIINCRFVEGDINEMFFQQIPFYFVVFDFLLLINLCIHHYKCTFKYVELLKDFRKIY